MHSSRYARGSKGYFKAGKTQRRVAAKAYAARNRRTGGYAGKEVRYNDVYISNIKVENTAAASVIDPATLNCLNGLAQGTGQSERGGLRATIKSIHIRGDLKWKFSPTGGCCRILLVKDRQTNGAQMTGAELWNILAVSLYIQTSQHLNLENSHRFQVLADKKVKFVTQNHYLNAAGSDVAPSVITPFEIKHFFKGGMVTRFLDTGNTVSDIADNSLHLIAINSDSTISTALDMSYVSRVRFYAD